jgi:hypothetical protein
MSNTGTGPVRGKLPTAGGLVSVADTLFICELHYGSMGVRDFQPPLLQPKWAL